MPKLTSKQQHWSYQLLQAEAFDGSLAQYAQTHNIPVQTLYRWRNYFKQSSPIEPKSKPRFAQVIHSPATDACIRLQMGKTQLQFTRLPDPQWLAAFLCASNTL